MIYELGRDEESLERAEQMGGYYERHQGFARVRVCTAKHLREVLRKIWEDKRDGVEDPILGIMTKSDNTLYVGCRADNWVTAEEVETFGCTQSELGPRSFRVDDIIVLYVN